MCARLRSINLPFGRTGILRTALVALFLGPGAPPAQAGADHIPRRDEGGREKVERIGGIVYTIKDGIVYDAPALLEDVAEMVRAEKERRGIAGIMSIVNAD